MSQLFDIAEASRFPKPGFNVPIKVAFSPSGRYLAWLYSPGCDRRRELFLHDLVTETTRPLEMPQTDADESDLSTDEKLRRERARELGVGVTTFSWETNNDRLVVPLANVVWRYETATQTWTTPWDTHSKSLIDPRVSPCGEKLAFVSDGELFVCDPRCRRISPPAGPAVTHGLADYIAQEELGRSRGFWWSNDSSQIAYTTVDESAIPEYTIPAFASDDPYASETYRYSFPGGTNASVRLFTIDVGSGETNECELAGAEYLARVHWHDKRVIVETLDRKQRELRVTAFVGATRQDLWSESSEAWVDLHNCFRTFEDGRMLWASERTGFRHLEVRTEDGALERVLTEGDWTVCDVAAVSASNVWFTATADGELERRLYRVDIQGGDPQCLTPAAGFHRVNAHGGSGKFVDLHHSSQSPPAMKLHDLQTGEETQTLFDDVDPRIEQFALRPPTLEAISASDGTRLNVALYVPEGEGPFPTVLTPYGGPGEGAQQVLDSWAMTSDLEIQWMVRHGICVVVADNRGTWGRGRAFYEAIRNSMGTVDVEDQADVVAELSARKLVDPARVAITGWSYGGYLALMCLARRPDVFTAAVAGAPVTDWLRYDTAYTERYMGLPEENAGAYDTASVLTHAHRITGSLLLVAGLIDENVHFRHTAALLRTLAEHGVDYDLVAYPDERHLPRDPKTRIDLDRKVTTFLLTALGVQP